MAKDRDRRYQTPEHLVRDLLGVAGSIGLATPSSSVPGLAGGRHSARLGAPPRLAGAGRCARRRRVWVWPGGVETWPGRRRARSVRPSSAVTRRSSEAASASGSSLSGSAAGAAERAQQYRNGELRPRSTARNIPVSSNEDLLEIIATAPRRSVIVLSDDGPYQLGGRAWSFRAPAPLSNADLTIKAEAGVRPVLKFASDARLADRPPASLLHFVGGHVTIEGVAFDLDVVLPDEPVAAIRADGTELTLRGCSFRRTNSREGRNVAAVSIRKSIRRPLPVTGRPRCSSTCATSTEARPRSSPPAPSTWPSEIVRWARASPRSGSTTRARIRRCPPSFDFLTRASWPAPTPSFGSTAARSASGSTTAWSPRPAGRPRPW